MLGSLDVETLGPLQKFVGTRLDFFDTNQDMKIERPLSSLAAGPFASGSKLFQGANWVPKINRGTNDYAHCSHLIYLYDQYMNPYVARWLEDNTRAFDEAYAITELTQWLWRSRVRKGQPITLYLPSPRMRQLME